MFYDYLAYSKPNYLKNKRDQNQKNAYVVYVEKKTENIEKKPIKEQKENIKETKENFGHQTKLKYLKKSTNYEKRYYKSKKNQNKNTEQLFYYEPKVLINGKVLSEEKDVNIKENVDMKNNAQTPSEKTMKTENFKCEEAGKIELLPIINNLKKDIFNELEEKMDVKKNEIEKNILSRKSSNTIDNIVNNVFDDLDLNENSWNYENEEKLLESNFANNLYEDDDDFELMDLIFQREDKTQSYNSNSAYWEPFNKEYPNKEPFFKEYATKPDFPFQIKDPAFQKTTLPFLNNPQNLENQQYLSQNKWKPNFYLQYNNSNKNINQEMLNAKSSASLRNSKINQINFSQNEMVSNYNNNESFSFRFLFKDLFPTNFEHSKFPIFSLFIQRIPNHDILEEVWYYKDPQGEIQGPFNSNDMDNWNNDGYFSLELEIGWNQNKVFVMIENFIQNPCILIDLSLKHANLTKYFRNILNSGQFLEFKKQNAAKNVNSLSFNNYATSIISKNYNISKNNQEKISTESLKCLLGIQPALSLNFVEKKGMV